MYNTSPVAAIEATNPLGSPSLGAFPMSPLAGSSMLGTPMQVISNLNAMAESLALEGRGEASAPSGPESQIQGLLAEIQRLQQELMQEVQSGQDPTATENQLSQDEQMLQAMLGSASSGSGGGVPVSGGGGDGGGSVGGGGSASGGSGGDSGGSGSSGPVVPIQATGDGGQAVQIAQGQLGKDAQNVNLANYSHAGGVTNDCADFVSACIADAGRFHKTAGDVNVVQFQKDLVAQGYHSVAKAQAQPGDVAIILGGGVQHTELVAAPGATTAIGANGSSQERVSAQSLDWASGVTYYHLDSSKKA